MIKKFLLLFASIIFISTANADDTIKIQNTAATIPASGVLYSQPLNLSSFDGYFSVQTVVTGDGTLSISYELSNSKTAPYTWSVPVGASAIATGLTAATYMHKFEPHCIGYFLRLVYTETGTSDSVTINSNLAGQ